MEYFTYILKSKKDNGFYYGHTSNLEKRLKEHNNGKTKSIKSRLPFEIHYYEKFESKSEAYSREKFFKSLEGRNWLKSNQVI